MRIDENWAIDIKRLRSFFRQQEDIKEENEHFIFGDCHITLIPQNGNTLNKWPISRTEIIFEGDDEHVQAIHRRFFLRFLSAGG